MFKEIRLKFKKSEHKSIWIALSLFAISGVVFLIIVSAESTSGTKTWLEQKSYWTTLGTSLLLGGACATLGALIGFLFGIPKIKERDNQNNGKGGSVIHNDNLVQVSDWLTKIIVGVGLTELKNFPEILRNISVFVSPIFRTKPTSSMVLDGANVTSVSVVLYFFILGFITFYLWTRFKFFEMIEETIEDSKDNSIETSLNHPQNIDGQNIDPQAKEEQPIP